MFEGLRILCFNLRFFKEDDMINFFGCLFFDEINVGEEKIDVLVSCLYMVEFRFCSYEF